MSRAELELDALELEPGQSVRMTCPFCKANGKTLSLTHKDDGTLLYHCYRASCVGGGVLGKGATYAKPPAERSSRTKPYIEERLRQPCGNGRVWDLLACELYDEGVLWDPETHRFALPVYTPGCRLRGRVLRVPPGDTRHPKALTWMYEEGPTLAWNRVGRDTVVVVVEDIPSALKLGVRGYRAVALNGTHMTAEAFEELDRNADNVVWALDKDAFAKAQAYHKQYRMYFGESCALLLPKDFKDMGWEEIDECLSETYWGQYSRAGTPTSESAD